MYLITWRLFSFPGQKRLKKASVLVVGCGGLGCPAAQYMAGCGIGRIGLVDYDVVELSNLHRQLLHSEFNLGVPKVTSLAQALLRLNSSLKIDEYNVQLSSANALEIFAKYDIIVDASDNVATRYLVNDAAVLSGRPLVSGGAVGCEGQLTVYNYKDGPCYRCLFPEPPPPETVSNCSDVGVVGPVPGCIGVLQALQVIHIITEKGEVASGKLLLFDGVSFTFRSIRLRGKSPTCKICGSEPTITQLMDYEQFCGLPANDKDSGLNILDASERVSPVFLEQAIAKKLPLLLIDVRSPVEFEMCRLPESTNIPLKLLNKEETVDRLKEMWATVAGNQNAESRVYLVCRRGNDSQLGVRRVQNILKCQVFDVKGGLHAWSRDVDPSFPIY
ncbi:unnamed protein product [Nesidiocoris tenuis]|uniref:Adenylyltransferase and sulfurtransferase MOCS3 homolog n=1 Tax=Nesidiocoris tenuis TaxID=355587 RepID=A0A6H5GT86_9HEMI|nr:unnamed protein product [Nesidiocoris tenuis]